ncbi:hypothetical protein MTO96_047553 [Rhipicephalus appendiculatus]
MERLTDEWKAKYANPPTSTATEDSPTTAGEDAEALVHDLRKHLQSAKEAEQLVLSFQRLGKELGSRLHSQLEQLLAHQQDLQLKVLRASLEEQHSQEKTALLSEQVVRTKELLSKHRAEVEQLEKDCRGQAGR